MSTEKQLHIVSFDVPYPADYGGVIDIYYRIKALHELGVKIYLHCFEYGRGEATQLNAICEQVFYYKRKLSPLDSISSLPFIVKTRRSNALLQNLIKVEAPILFEGLHTTYYLTAQELRERTKIVRTHNVEHDYYEQLAAGSMGWRRRFHRGEAKKLKGYERILKNADHVLAIKQGDADHFRTFHSNVSVLPASFQPVADRSQTATEPYVLFHGNLSVAENEQAAMWLLEQVFPIENIRVVIAGKNPSKALVSAAQQQKVELIANPDHERMDELVSKARIHVLPTKQSTGVKLKLVHALGNSGHVLVNQKMVEGTLLGEICTVLENTEEWKKSIQTLIERELSASEFQSRKTFLNTHFNTKENCRIILDLI